MPRPYPQLSAPLDRPSLYGTNGNDDDSREPPSSGPTPNWPPAVWRTGGRRSGRWTATAREAAQSGRRWGSSPFLADCLLRFPDFSRKLAAEGPDGPLEALFARIRELPADCDTAGWMRTFREERARLAAAVAVADVAGEWTLERVTGTLSSFAAAALDAAVRHLLATGREYSGAAPEGSGIVVLGMGKLGAGELNYSSDIDIVLIYDEAVLPVRRRDRTGQTMVRFARDLVRLLQERTADGYVQRVDLRLRPDPASTPLAVPVRAAEAYYESMGQNWERAAMLKARPVAGDLAAGQAFLDYIRPFVWRRQPRLLGHTGHPFHQAPDPRPSRP